MWTGQIIGYWLLSAAPGIPMLMLYWAYRYTLEGKRLAVRQIILNNDVFESHLKAFIRPSGKSEAAKPTAEDLVTEHFKLYYHGRHYFFGIVLNLIVITLAMAATLKAHRIPVSFPPLTR